MGRERENRFRIRTVLYSLNESRSESFDYTIDNLLAYQNSFGGHTVDVLLGTSWTREYYRTMSVSSDNHDLGGPDITGYNGPGTVGCGR